MKTLATAALAVAILAAPVCAAARAEIVPDQAIAALAEENLARHFESVAIERYLAGAGEEERGAVQFLLAWLPPSDLGALPADLLLENVELALKAWRAAPWRDEIDPYLFCTYVLPHRVSQEPVQNWRRRLRDLVGPRVEGMTLEDAALEVNRFCREWATYTPTSGRDQGPLTTMRRGLGRCEEEMILTICAMRSVGIPARACSVPCWCTSDGNHAWTEVYTGREGGWRYLGSCEPAACLDQAWFTGAASRTGAVYSVGYGEAPVPAEYESALSRQADGVTVLNSIEVYGDPGTLVPAVGASGVTDGEADVHVHTFNWGGLVPIARVRADQAILLGPGDYVLTAEVDGSPRSAIASVRSGATTRVALEPGLAVLENAIWLRAAPPSEPGDDCRVAGDDPVWLRHEREIARRDLERCRSSLPSPEWTALVGEGPDAEALAERMESAGPTQAEWSSAVAGLDDRLRPRAFALLEAMDTKDFYEGDPELLGSILEATERVRATAGASLADSLWDRHVLPPRLHRQAGTMRWWLDLPTAGDDAARSPGQVLGLFRGHVTRLERTHLGHVAAPEETWRAGYASPPSSRACLAALLRTHGIPARAGLGVPYVEAWEDGRWSRFVPFADDAEEGDERDDGTGGMAYVAARYSDRGRPVDEIETWRQTRLTTFTDGAFRTWYPGQLSEGGGLVEWSLEEGTYWLFGGLRNPRGEPRFVARCIDVAPGDTVRIDLDIGIPLDEWDERDLVAREWDTSNEVSVTFDGATVDLRELAKDGAIVVVTLSGHEASTRQLGALRETDWETLGLEFLPLRLSGVSGHAPEPGGATIERDVAADAFGVVNPVRDLPLTVVLDSTGETLLWLRGMRLDTSDYVRGLIAGDR